MPSVQNERKGRRRSDLVTRVVTHTWHVTQEKCVCCLPKTTPQVIPPREFEEFNDTVDPNLEDWVKI